LVKCWDKGGQQALQWFCGDCSGKVTVSVKKDSVDYSRQEILEKDVEMLKKEIEDIKQVLIGRKMSFRDLVLEEKRFEEENKKEKGSTEDTGGWV